MLLEVPPPLTPAAAAAELALAAAAAATPPPARVRRRAAPFARLSAPLARLGPEAPNVQSVLTPLAPAAALYAPRLHADCGRAALVVPGSWFAAAAEGAWRAAVRWDAFFEAAAVTRHQGRAVGVARAADWDAAAHTWEGAVAAAARTPLHTLGGALSAGGLGALLVAEGPALQTLNAAAPLVDGARVAVGAATTILLRGMPARAARVYAEFVARAAAEGADGDAVAGGRHPAVRVLGRERELRVLYVWDTKSE
jgi:hypothetical protein